MKEGRSQNRTEKNQRNRQGIKTEGRKDGVKKRTI